MQGPPNAFGIARNDDEVSLGRLVRHGPALFPVAQSPKGNVVSHGELFLSQPECAAEGFDSRNATELSEPRSGKRRVFRVATRGGFNFRIAHRGQRWSVQSFFGPTRFDPN